MKSLWPKDLKSHGLPNFPNFWVRHSRQMGNYSDFILNKPFCRRGYILFLDEAECRLWRGRILQPRSRIGGNAWVELQNGRNLSKYSIESDVKILLRDIKFAKFCCMSRCCPNTLGWHDLEWSCLAVDFSVRCKNIIGQSQVLLHIAKGKKGVQPFYASARRKVEVYYVIWH
jgi:hypothetical protein